MYYIDYEGCPIECTEEEYNKEQERMLSQTTPIDKDKEDE